jgi:hypothetical protein
LREGIVSVILKLTMPLKRILLASSLTALAAVSVVLSSLKGPVQLLDATARSRVIYYSDTMNPFPDLASRKEGKMFLGTPKDKLSGDYNVETTFTIDQGSFLSDEVHCWGAVESSYQIHFLIGVGLNNPTSFTIKYQSNSSLNGNTSNYARVNLFSDPEHTNVIYRSSFAQTDFPANAASGTTKTNTKTFTNATPARYAQFEYFYSCSGGMVSNFRIMECSFTWSC